MKIRVRLSDACVYPAGYKAGDIVEVQVSAVVFPDYTYWGFSYQASEVDTPRVPWGELVTDNVKSKPEPKTGEKSVVTFREFFGQDVQRIEFK